MQGRRCGGFCEQSTQLLSPTYHLSPRVCQDPERVYRRSSAHCRWTIHLIISLQGLELTYPYFIALFCSWCFHGMSRRNLPRLTAVGYDFTREKEGSEVDIQGESGEKKEDSWRIQKARAHVKQISMTRGTRPKADGRPCEACYQRLLL